MLAIFPEIVAIAKRRDFERLAIAVRTYFLSNQSTNPRLDIVDLAENVGLNVEDVPLNHFAALVVKDENGKFTANLFIKSGLPAYEREFCLAHGLGHFFLHILPQIADADWKTGGFKETSSPLERFVKRRMPTKSHDIEAEADFFAAALLLPSGMVKRAYAALKTVERTAAFFGVDIEVTKRRLALLEAIKVAEPKKVNTNMGMERIRQIARDLDK